jgi:hypothetical protein
MITRHWLVDLARDERTTPVEIVQEAVDVFFALRYYLDGSWDALVRDAARHQLSTGELLVRIVDETLEADRRRRPRKSGSARD